MLLKKLGSLAGRYPYLFNGFNRLFACLNKGQKCQSNPNFLNLTVLRCCTNNRNQIYYVKYSYSTFTLLMLLLLVTLVLLGLLVSLGENELLPMGKPVLFGLDCAKQIPVRLIPKIKNMIILIFISSLSLRICSVLEIVLYKSILRGDTK